MLNAATEIGVASALTRRPHAGSGSEQTDARSCSLGVFAGLVLLMVACDGARTITARTDVRADDGGSLPRQRP
jgi:hypothetical protein